MPTSLRRSYKNEPNVFCYICGKYTLEYNKKTISDFVKCTYLAYFKAGMGNHCRRGLAPAPAPELPSAYPLAPAPAFQLFNKQVVHHLVFKYFLP